MKKIIISITTLAFLFNPTSALAWSEYYVPTRFEGMQYTSGNYSNKVNLATLDDNAFTEINVTFGNPAPSCHYQSFGFTAPEILGRTVTEIELELRARKRFNVTPGETIEAWIVKPDGLVSTALNATDTNFYQDSFTTGYTWYSFYWRDEEATPRVSEYLPYFDDYDFTLVLCAKKNSSSGSTNFLEISQLKIRFETGESDASPFIPQDITKIDLAVEQLTDTISSRAPFAYFHAVGTMDYDSITGEEFGISIPVPYPDGTVYYEAELPTQMNDVLNAIKTLTGIAMLGSFVIYLYRLADRVYA